MFLLLLPYQCMYAPVLPVVSLLAVRWSGWYIPKTSAQSREHVIVLQCICSLTDEAQRGRHDDAMHHIAVVPMEVAQRVHSQGQARQRPQYPEQRRVTADMMVAA